jgi:hypothetical protein
MVCYTTAIASLQDSLNYSSLRHTIINIIIIISTDYCPSEYNHPDPYLSNIYESLIPVSASGKILVLRFSIIYNCIDQLNYFCSQIISECIVEFELPDDKLIVIVEDSAS